MDIVRVLGLAVESFRRAGKIEPANEVAISALRWEIYSCLQNLLDSLAMIAANLGLVKPSSPEELGGCFVKKV